MNYVEWVRAKLSQVRAYLCNLDYQTLVQVNVFTNAKEKPTLFAAHLFEAFKSSDGVNLWELNSSRVCYYRRCRV